MDIFEITGNRTGVDRSGVNFLQPMDAYQNIEDGFIYRQVLQSRQGVGYFAPRLSVSGVSQKTRVFGIFEHTLVESTKDLLVFDQNFCYKFNNASGNFDKVPFGGSMAAYGGFNIPSKEMYISGTSYPDFENKNRFVFTGSGIQLNSNDSAVFFYDNDTTISPIGEIKDYTNGGVGGDNPKYQQPFVNGASQKLNRAKYVIWFGERLNFFHPTIGAGPFPQGILYSGIRNVDGNGDRYNIAGSGLLNADTYEYMNGASILGQVMVMNFNRSNWTLEKTTDAFNPYFVRKVPSVLGTDASYSFVSWNDKVKSVGKTGIISTDGRQSLRSDNKIPYFTADEIDQVDFELTYGGFDRVNNQFLWSYKQEDSDPDADSNTQNHILVSNYEEDTWSVFNLRLTIFGQTDSGLNLLWNQIDGTSGNEAWAKWNTTTTIWNKIGLGKAVQKTLAGDDEGFIYEFNQDYNDYFANISAITNADSAVLTVSESSFKPGDLVAVSDVEGMFEINNFDNETTNYQFIHYTVLEASDISITLDVSSTLFDPYTSGGKITKVIEFKAETIPFNPYRADGRLCFISHIEFLIDTNGGFLRVDIYQDEETSPYKQDILLAPFQQNTASREWITMSVDNEANFHTIVMKQTSPSQQVRLTSMRIHARPGGYTSG